MTISQNLLVELFVEELPPKALRKLGDAFGHVLLEQLRATGLASSGSQLTAFASPRRLAAHVTGVASAAADQRVSQKLMPVAVGIDASGQPTPALLKKLQALGADASAVSGLARQMDGKAEALFYSSTVRGATLAEGLQKALSEAIAKLPIPKVMTYQLADGWSDVKFVRPAHGLVALHGSDVVPIEALGLKAGNITHGHRFEAAVDPVVLKEADSYAATLLKDGAVIAGFDERRAEIVRQLGAAAVKVGGGVTVIDDEALLDEVTALVERPNVLVCEFEKEFLDVPQECLILTMKANQKYFPLLDSAGKLTNKFMVVSNITPADPSLVIGGNERVVRPRLADAKFFFDQDRKKTLASRVEGLSKVVYHNKLGTQLQRTERVREIARAIGRQVGGPSLAENAFSAAHLAKADLLTDMVGEFPELQGVMGNYYARCDGQLDAIATAIEDHYKPRFAGDDLPRQNEGLVVALADKLETLICMFGVGNFPTGDKDPFALRRHALGLIRMLVERELNLSLNFLIVAAAHPLIKQQVNEKQPDLQFLPITPGQGQSYLLGVQNHFGVKEATGGELEDFIFDRFASALREQGHSAQQIDAVLSMRPQRLSDVPKRLAAVRTFAALPEAPALAAANKRVGNILKKADGSVEAKVDAALLHEPAEKALADAIYSVAEKADKGWATGDYTANLQALAALKAPVDEFFDKVMVNADDPALRSNRLGLLKTLHAAMNRVADLSRLAS
jgi:glycyl-tRNA synthetase beta chain